jgi:hypothetical protein
MGAFGFTKSSMAADDMRARYDAEQDKTAIAVVAEAMPPMQLMQWRKLC